MPSFFQLIQRGLRNVFNIFVFLPYYFNVETHLKNIFSPWKRIVSIKKQVGFSWEAAIDTISMNTVSRGIGFTMRFWVLVGFLLTIGAYMMVLVPVWILCICVAAPFSYLLQQVSPPARRKKIEKDTFIKMHSLEEKSIPLVDAWFEKIYFANELWKDSFALTNLLTIPPVGRDWNNGFTPELDQYTVDITESFSKNVHLIGRKEEVQFVERELVKTEEANVVLVGDEGVGKHTIINELAHRMYSGTTIAALQNMRILSLNMDKVLSTYHAYDEEAAFLEELLREAAAAKNIIVVLNNFHTYCSSELRGDFSSVWEQFGKTPYVKFLAVTTPFYYQRTVYENEKIQRLFTKIDVVEVTPEKTIAILEDKVPFFEAKYHVVLPFETLEHMVNRCEFYIPAVLFPEKAIKLLDEVCVWAREKEASHTVILANVVDSVLSQRTRIPVGALTADFKEKLLNIETILNKKIRGQDEVVTAVSQTLRRAFIEENRKKPKASMLFLGPTGVGKTETAKVLAETFFGSKEKVIRFDMSFYQEQKTLEDLIGSYQHKNPGLFAATIRENPFCVLLIDEIEKAHKDILSVFLTMLDEGYLVDGFGEKVDCKNLLIVATSNAVATVFTPEFINRFDNVLVFQPLTVETAFAIGASVMHAVISEYKKSKNIELPIDVEKLRELIREKFNPQNGARDVERTVRNYCADLVAEVVLSS